MNTHEARGASTRVLVPLDSGFASGGFGPFRFPLNVLAVLCTPWTWPMRLAILAEPLWNRLRIARGKAPLGYEYRDFPSTMTLVDLIEHLGYSGTGMTDFPRFSAYGHRPIGEIPSETLTEAIKDAQVALW